MFINHNIARKYSASSSYGLDSNLVRPATKRSQQSIKIIQWIKINSCSHPILTKNIDYTHRGVKNIFNMSLIIPQNKTNTKNPNISIPTK